MEKSLGQLEKIDLRTVLDERSLGFYTVARQ
jgi:hypothetical protein